jgi:hypothetical protein
MGHLFNGKGEYEHSTLFPSGPKNPIPYDLDYDQSITNALDADEILGTFCTLTYKEGHISALRYLEALIRNCPEKRAFLITHPVRTLRECSSVLIKKVQEEENKSGNK